MAGKLMLCAQATLLEDVERWKRSFVPSVHSTPVQLDDDGFLWEITYESFDKRYADLHFAPMSFGCSGIQKGGLRGRNFDWFYGDSTTFILHKKPFDGSPREITGIAYLSNVTSGQMKDGYSGSALEYLPFRLVDGINDAGLLIQTNVAPPNEPWGRTTGTNPGKPILWGLEFCQYMLGKCSTVKDVMDELDKVNFMAAYGTMVEEFHFMVKDRDGVEGIIEFVDNKPVFVEPTEDEPCIMTNFNVYEYIRGNYGLRPAGLERYAILKDQYDEIYDVESMMKAMESVKYSRAFSGECTDDGAWLSEALGDWGEFGGNLTYDNTHQLRDVEKFEKPWATMKWMEKHDPVGHTWWTIHTTVYDTDNGKMYLAIHEDYGKIYEFDIPKV